MKKLVTLALVASAVGAPAMADRLNVNTQDVQQGRVDGRSLSRYQAGKLSLEVGIARFVARTLRNKQGLMDQVGVDGYKNWQTISIGAGTAAAEFAAGLAAIKYIPQERLFALDPEVRDLYTKMNLVEDQIANLQTKKGVATTAPVAPVAPVEVPTVIDAPVVGEAPVVAEGRPVLSVEREIENLNNSLDSYAIRARTLEENAPLWKRSWRPLRVTFAYTVGGLLIYDAATQALQITFDAYRDDRNLLGELDKFIADGRATLSDRE